MDYHIYIKTNKNNTRKMSKKHVKFDEKDQEYYDSLFDNEEEGVEEVEGEEVASEPVYRPKVTRKSLNRLLSLLEQQAESYNISQQHQIVSHFLKMFEEVDPKTELKIEKDDAENYYITKGEGVTTPDGEVLYPCSIAHLDQVHSYYDHYNIRTDGDIIYAFGRSKSGFYDQLGTGGDDLCGVWLCLEMLLHFKSMKVALFVDEEVGCIGSGKADLSFFADCSFILQGDRRHDTEDFIQHTNGVQVISREFKAEVKPILDEFGYDFNYGSLTDVGELVGDGAGCCGANVSCGYYDAHTKSETVSISKAFTCKELFIKLFKDLCYKRWEHTAEKTYGRYYGGGGTNYYDRLNGQYFGGGGGGWGGRDWYDPTKNSNLPEQDTYVGKKDKKGTGTWQDRWLAEWDEESEYPHLSLGIVDSERFQNVRLLTAKVEGEDIKKGVWERLPNFKTGENEVRICFVEGRFYKIKKLLSGGFFLKFVAAEEVPTEVLTSPLPPAPTGVGFEEHECPNCLVDLNLDSDTHYYWCDYCDFYCNEHDTWTIKEIRENVHGPSVRKDKAVGIYDENGEPLTH